MESNKTSISDVMTDINNTPELPNPYIFVCNVLGLVSKVPGVQAVHDNRILKVICVCQIVTEISNVHSFETILADTPCPHRPH
jgi:hypothetical protein